MNCNSYNNFVLVYILRLCLIVNIAGASFILYNVARIATIIRKYNERVLYGDYPSLPNIGNVDFSELHEEVSKTYLLF